MEKRRVSFIVLRDCICYNGLMCVFEYYKRGGDFFFLKFYKVNFFRIWCNIEIFVLFCFYNIYVNFVFLDV